MKFKPTISLADVTGQTFWKVLQVTERVDAANRVTYCTLEEIAAPNNRRPTKMECWVPHEVLYVAA